MVTRAYIPAVGAEIHIAEINAQLRDWLAHAVAKDVRIFAPVDTSYMKTHVEVERENTRIHVLGAGIPPNKDAPVYVEYGTRHTPNHAATPAQPFMRPAAYRRRAIPGWAVRTITDDT